MKRLDDSQLGRFAELKLGVPDSTKKVDVATKEGASVQSTTKTREKRHALLQLSRFKAIKSSDGRVLVDICRFRTEDAGRMLDGCKRISNEELESGFRRMLTAQRCFFFSSRSQSSHSQSSSEVFVSEIP